jgi:predicted SAM-dependent methyltransferase
MRATRGFAATIRRNPRFARLLAETEWAPALWQAARATQHRAIAGHLVRRRRVERYLASTTTPMLHFGAGPYELPGWLNTDIGEGPVHIDLTRRLPFEAETFAYAFGEHVIEHLDEGAGQTALAELCRVLRPGGTLRLTTPDLKKIVSLYDDTNPVVRLELYARYLDETTGRRHDRPCQVINNFFRLWGHRYIYDETDLTAKLYEAGFESVERIEPGNSRIVELQDVERHGPEPWVNNAEAMSLEATKAICRRSRTGSDRGGGVAGATPHAH